MPLNQRITAHLRQLILEGAIDPGARLPAQRLLANDLRVSRNTILSVLQQLTSEGLVETRAGSGTYVVREPTPFGPQISLERQPAPTVAATETLPFEAGVPALNMFPMELWNRVQGRRWRNMSRSVLEEGHPAGWPPLRALIAARLAAMRGIKCSPEQIMIVPSAQTAVELAGRSLASAGERAWVEDPGYWRARDALASASLDVTPVSVDAYGFNLSAARIAGAARLAYVTPCTQFPTGVAMSAQRRRELLAWARENDGWIIEDEFESDFCFEGRPPRPLAAEEGGERVVYIGTFNSVMFPSLRIAYLVAPEATIDRFLAARTLTDRSMNTPVQAVLQDFMEDGHLAAHIRTCRAVYAERRDALVQALKMKLGGACEVLAPPMGLVVNAWLPSGGCDRALKQAAERKGLTLNIVSDHALLPCRPGMFLGFAPFPTAQIRRAVDRLAAAYEEVCRRP